MASRWVARRLVQWAALGSAVLAAGCPDPFDSTRSPAPRGTVGQELFGVVCDRLGAQSLQEDLTGASFHGICHLDATGKYADKVDQTQLPPSDPNAVDVNNNPVSVATQDANRAHAVARVEALARRRSDLIGSFDFVFPDKDLAVVDADGAQLKSDPASKLCVSNGTRKLSDELANLLARMQALYNDGTLPQTTESLARIFDALKASPDAQTAFARFEARQGYRPIELGLGAARPVIAYDHLRDFANTAMALFSADSQPYNTSKLDANGNRVPIPGPANAQLNQLVAVAHNELKYATIDPDPGTLVTVTDGPVGRTVLSRPRTDLEVLENVFYASHPDFGFPGATSNLIALRDWRGYVSVPFANGAAPAPFVEAKDPTTDAGLGYVAIDPATGLFKTVDNSVPPSPLVGLTADSASRDNCGRVLRSGAAAGGVPEAGAVAEGGADAGSGGGGGTGTSPTEVNCGARDDQLLYGYIDTSYVFARALMRDMTALANPDTTQRHETLMYTLAGAPVLFGKRDGSAKSSKCYAPDPANPSSCKDPASLLKYDAFQTDNSALIDLVYAFGQMLGDKSMDDTLSYVKALFTDQLPSVARLAGDGLTMKAQANAHTEAKIPAASTFWDEMLDVTVQLEKEPGLLEDVLRALGTDGTKNLGQIFANYMTYDDQISYDPGHLNGPAFNVTLGQGGAQMSTPVDRTAADTGFNRSAMFRFLSLIHDTNGVTACNKDQAVVHTHGLSLLFGAITDPDVCSGGLCNGILLGIGKGPPFKECEVFKIENLAKFYLDTIVEGARDPNLTDPRAAIYFRPNILRNGIAGLGAATVGLIEQSSGLGYEYNTPKDGQGTSTDAVDGFFGGSNQSLQKFYPRPQWLNRLVFFDQTTNTNPTDKYSITQHFLQDLQGAHIGSSVCPERVIPDPCVAGATGVDCAGAPDVAADGKVHGLRQCADGDWLDQRGKDTIFVWEQFNFYDSITPLLSVFVNHNREDLFIDLMETLYRHWADARGTPSENKLSSDPTAKYQQVTQDGVVTYEPLLAQLFSGDILSALHDLEPILESEKIQSCTATDAKTGLCTSQQAKDGITVLANATRALVDPDQAAAVGLKDRRGVVTGLRNDGSTNPQVTPIYLLTGALNAMDAAFTPTTNPDPTDDRFAQWRLARSQLVDQFLAVDASSGTPQFVNKAIPRIVPTILDATRAQLFANCPASFSAPFTRCGWARDDLTQKLTNVVQGPTFAATMDLLEAVRKDPASRAQMGQLLEYLLTKTDNDALTSLLASANDIIQLLKDDTNLVPLYQALAPGMAATTTDANGNLEKSVIDAQLALLGRLSGRALDSNGNEVCSAELDPNQVLTLALKNLVTPMPTASGGVGLAPLQTIMDVIGDVNRADPSQAGAKFQGGDYANIADQASQFLLDKQRGLEQFYAIVKNGTVKE